MAEQPAGNVSSIKARIASLNLEEVHAPAPGTRPGYQYEHAGVKKKAPPPPPPGAKRMQSVNNPPLLSNGTTSARQTIGNEPIAGKKEEVTVAPTLPPRLPPRRESTLNEAPSLPPRKSPNLPPRQSPCLPPRKSSEMSIRRQASNESISTIASGISVRSVGSTRTTASAGGTLYHVRAPAYDPSKLPPLPPKATVVEPKQSATLKAIKSKSNTVQDRNLPPQLPDRPPLPARTSTKSQGDVPVVINSVEEIDNMPRPPKRGLPAKKSALEFGMNRSTETPPPLPITRPSWSNNSDHSAPPPVPRASRPNLDAIMASKPKPGAVGHCLKCRDYSGPDDHATRFPRQNLPSSDVGWLAHQLCSPFPSHTDKARAIFAWLHYNILYDTQAFYSGNIRGSTPESTLTSGLAVCEGYAGLFCAMALKAGLECIVVGGSGKGYGHTPLQPGDPIPPFEGNHAWNAVRIDHGEWKLIDPCWGAGHVEGANMPYKQHFDPSQFTKDNNEFGLTHYPSDRAHFFRIDGRASISWEEYMREDMGERLMVYSSATPDHGFGARTFQPALKHIKVNDPQSGPVVRFQFASICPHWDNERHGKGKPYVMVLHVGGRDGRKTDWIPFQTDGKVYWLDVNRTELGAPGQKVSVYAVTSIDGKDARGVSYEEYKQKKGRAAMGFGGVAMWELI